VAVSAPYIRQPRFNDPTADRVGGALGRDVQQALDGLLFARAIILRVTKGQALTGPRRLYTTSGDTTTDIQVFNSGETLVPHPLGQTPQGWFVVGQSANANLFNVTPTVATDPAQYLVFRASSTTTFRIVVF
jgi:hypothetical protein